MKSDSGILIGSAPVFEKVSRSAVRGLWAQRSQLGLVGAHINVFTGEWTHKVFFSFECQQERLFETRSRVSSLVRRKPYLRMLGSQVIFGLLQHE